MAKARHYEIENNRVYEVEQVREKVGIIAKGFDFLDNEVVINNIDAGDAKALFKIARY
jgi:ABC-type phosphate/phosphonate transport system ATPase subunit